MTELVVTTRTDGYADDGLLSLREALLFAEIFATPVTIRFDPAAFAGSSNGTTAKLDLGTLAIGAPAKVTIEGRIGLDVVRIDGGFTGHPNAPNPGSRIMTIAAGAEVMLRGVALAKGFERGAAGLATQDGTEGASGGATTIHGAPGPPGNGGTGATGAVTNGGPAIAGISNAGSLTLDGVFFAGMNALAGVGGADGGAAVAIAVLLDTPALSAGSFAVIA
ncbi:hypothetical protein AAFN86_23250 [Roseomonas sp. CAU 1739]|uniref:hypothetical protein n=1 Tax=Roseomonas sp. CAU 1739 TaxID=3140364 RepID=UPI00325C0B20